MTTPAVFFDRDGTLMEEVNYCSDPRQVRVFPGAAEALRRLKAAGYRILIITNQSGIGRGLFTEAQFRAVQDELFRQIGDEIVDETYFCPDIPGAFSPRRKPEPAMVLEAAAKFNIDLGRSFFVGDKADDIECGRRAGTRTILVETGYGAQEICQPEFRVPSVTEAIAVVLERT